MIYQKRSFLDVIKYLKMRLSWTIQVDPGPNDNCPYKKTKEEKKQKTMHVKTEADWSYVPRNTEKSEARKKK